MTNPLNRSTLFALSFVGIVVLTGLGVLAKIDQGGWIVANRITSDSADFLASGITLLGDMEPTGLITLVLAVLGWHDRGWRGLVPLLLFAGVALEILLKCYLPHPGPPVSRQLWHPPYNVPIEYLDNLIGLTLHGSVPFQRIQYSFPSGHVFRTTFLAEFAGGCLNCCPSVGRGLIVAMALTRIYLGEHWVSDVVGGLLLGLFCASIASVLYRAGQPAQP